MVHLKTGDHVVCSNAVFGATIQLFTNILGRYGIETTFVSPTRVEEWRQALNSRTRLLFLETPSNPLTEISDIAALATIARSAGALLAVDNVFCTPALQRPLALGADLVIHSATKYIDGQGRVMGGAVAGARSLVGEPMTAFLRTAGPTLSPFNAWVLLKGLETLSVRVARQTQTAAAVAEALAKHDKLAKVIYPGRADHPQADLVRKQMSGGSTLCSFEVKGGKAGAFRFLNALELISITNNLGDAKTLVTHPTTTTHQRRGGRRHAAPLRHRGDCGEAGSRVVAGRHQRGAARPSVRRPRRLAPRRPRQDQSSWRGCRAD
jgi:O-succinylhomoserine sulfhydrylase